MDPRSAPPARAFERTVAIAAQPAAVWAAMTDLGRMPRWIAGLREARLVPPGPLGPGARLVEVRRVGGRDHEVPVEVDAWDPPRRMVRTATTPVGRMTYTYTVEPAPGGARFTLRGEARPGGLGQRALLALMWPQLRRDEALPDRLKALVEAGPVAA